MARSTNLIAPLVAVVLVFAPLGPDDHATVPERVDRFTGDPPAVLIEWSPPAAPVVQSGSAPRMLSGDAALWFTADR